MALGIYTTGLLSFHPDVLPTLDDLGIEGDRFRWPSVVMHVIIRFRSAASSAWGAAAEFGNWNAADLALGIQVQCDVVFHRFSNWL